MCYKLSNDEFETKHWGKCWGILVVGSVIIGWVATEGKKTSRLVGFFWSTFFLIMILFGWLFSIGILRVISQLLYSEKDFSQFIAVKQKEKNDFIAVKNKMVSILDKITAIENL